MGTKVLCFILGVLGSICVLGSYRVLSFKNINNHILISSGLLATGIILYISLYYTITG